MGEIELVGKLASFPPALLGLCQWSRSATAMGHPMSFRETPGVISAQCSDSPDGHLDTSPLTAIVVNPRSDPRIAVGIDNVWILSILGMKAMAMFILYCIFMHIFFWDNGETHEEGVCLYVTYI